MQSKERFNCRHLQKQCSGSVSFLFDQASQGWKSVVVDFLRNLGVFCAARGDDGPIWIGTKWSYIYKSTDHGSSFNRIGESGLVKSNYLMA